eukprot:4489182-Prorocentrum_lima.AAC.1
MEGDLASSTCLGTEASPSSAKDVDDGVSHDRPDGSSDKGIPPRLSGPLAASETPAATELTPMISGNAKQA